MTLFVFNGGRLALIRKPSYPQGIWRPPGGGVKPGEDFVAGVRREAREELGVAVELTRYLVRSRAVFRCADGEMEWQTHVFAATTDDDELRPEDEVEIDDARWGTLAELNGALRERLLETGRALWRYRVALHDAAAAALSAS